MKRFWLSLLACASLILCGCHSTTEDSAVKILSNPSGAVVKISGVEVGKTPMTIRLSTFFETQVDIEKNGFKTETVWVRPVKRVLRPNPIKADLVPAMIPDDPTKAKYETCLQTLAWMRETGQFDKADLDYIAAYLETRVK